MSDSKTIATVPWTSDGWMGKKYPKPLEHGRLYVRENGEIEVNVDDDYYSGALSIAEAKQLYLALKSIFEQQVEEETVELLDSSGDNLPSTEYTALYGELCDLYSSTKK